MRRNFTTDLIHWLTLHSRDLIGSEESEFLRSLNLKIVGPDFKGDSEFLTVKKLFDQDSQKQFGGWRFYVNISMLNHFGIV